MEQLKFFYDCICCENKTKFADPYHFGFTYSNTSPDSIFFENNYVRTTRYSWFNFLPKALLLQFTRLANVYFLMIATLQSIPTISPLTPITAWFPLTVVLAVSIAREGFEDYQRYKSDQQLNHQLKASVSRDDKFIEVQWSQVKVGDICKVKIDELIPADLVLLSSSTDGGLAFIETASLDGQKNLKPRNAHKFTQKYCDIQLIKSLSGIWEGSIPDRQLHHFYSRMKIGEQIVVYEGDKQLLYRGARLKNTKWVYGLVVYTGLNTKIMMNSLSASKKMSHVEEKVNKILVFIFCFQTMLCLAAAILSTHSTHTKLQFISLVPVYNQTMTMTVVIMFFSYLILINSMIPISLIVSMEIVKLSQSHFINKDKLMYSQIKNKNVQVKSSSLNEELGQIQYIFTDKTGTLTMNIMEFKLAVIGNHIYSDKPHRPKTANLNASDVTNTSMKRSNPLNDLILHKLKNQKLPQPIIIKGQNPFQITTQLQLCEEFLMVLSIAHEVVVEQDQFGNSKYQGPSPDEITLVEAAKCFSFEFTKSTQSTTSVKIRDVQQQFELLQVFPFTSDRKRMSVIIKHNGFIKIYTKGADNIIKKRLSSDSYLSFDSELNQFSKQGLRTLLIAMKIISKQNYESFKRTKEKLPQLNRETVFMQLVSELETGLYLLGVTAVLDRLQQFVPQTIRDLIRANIKIWMLTGDKLETAENIAKSCNLLERQFSILRLKQNHPGGVLQSLQQIKIFAQLLSENKVNKGFIVEGDDLSVITSSDRGQVLLAQLAERCQTVVCCRLNPLQKAEIVKVVKNRLKKITLAIGDGANDVPMIKAADIGIGLFGQEGMNAVQASDYALPQFRMLWRLLLVHGRWNYIRISQMILYFFFKNMIFALPQFLISFVSGYSGQSIYDDWYISFYNLIFTSVPVVVRAVLEQDINYVVRRQTFKSDEYSTSNLIRKKTDKVIERSEKYLPSQYEISKFLYRLYPKLYFIGQKNCLFNSFNSAMWIIQAIVESLCVTFFCIVVLGSSTINSHGHMSSLWLVGQSIYTSIICIVTFKICMHTKFISKIFLFSVVFFTFILYLVYMWITNYVVTNNIAGTTIVAWTTPKAYFTVLFCICVVLLVDGVIVHLDFQRGGYASRVRSLIDQNVQETKQIYDMMSLKYSERVIGSPLTHQAYLVGDQIYETI